MSEGDKTTFSVQFGRVKACRYISGMFAIVNIVENNKSKYNILLCVHIPPYLSVFLKTPVSPASLRTVPLPLSKSLQPLHFNPVMRAHVPFLTPASRTHSFGDSIASRPVQAGEDKWKVVYFPKGFTDPDYASVYITNVACDMDEVRVCVRARVRVRLCTYARRPQIFHYASVCVT